MSHGFPAPLPLGAPGKVGRVPDFLRPLQRQPSFMPGDTEHALSSYLEVRAVQGLLDVKGTCPRGPKSSGPRHSLTSYHIPSLFLLAFPQRPVGSWLPLPGIPQATPHHVANCLTSVRSLLQFRLLNKAI